MIVQELFDTWENGTRLIRTYSDAQLKIRQIETGDIYDEAIDIEGRFTYEETDIPLEEPEEGDVPDEPEEEFEPEEIVE